MNLTPEIREKLWSFASRTSFQSDYLIQVQEWGKKIDPKKYFPPHVTELWLELGSGWGEVAIQLAEAFPNTGFLLMEKKIDRIKATEKKRKERGLENIRYMTLNFQWFFSELMDTEMFSTVLINFPDPWPKAKHWKHRLMQEEFLTNLHAIIKPEGRLLFATDYGPYARKTISMFRKLNHLFKGSTEVAFERPNFPVSFFEHEKREEGKRIYYLERTKVTPLGSY